MANQTIIITQSGATINSQEDWEYSINVERYTYKNDPDRFNVEISARKRIPIPDKNSYVLSDSVPILRYNRAPNILTLYQRLDEAYAVFQHMLKAIESRENSWDAREHKK